MTIPRRHRMKMRFFIFLSKPEFASSGHSVERDLIPAAANSDSFWDYQIREIPTRGWLLIEERRRWERRYRSLGLI